MNKKEQENNFRRIMFTGGSSFIVSLPKDWIDKQKLSKGSLVQLFESDESTLSIKPYGSEIAQKIRKATIKVSSEDSPHNVIKKLVSTYIQGFNIIQFESNEPRLDTNIKIKLKDFVRKKCVGTEILKETPNELTFQILLSYKDLSIEDALKRMSTITLAMHKDAHQALKIGDIFLAKEIIEMDDEVDRFSFYIIRLLTLAAQDPKILSEVGVGNLGNCMNYRIITKSIERTADHAVNIAKNLISIQNKNLKIELLSDLSILIESSLKIFENAVDSVINKNFLEAEKVTELAEDGKNKNQNLTIKINKSEYVKDFPQIPLILESINRVSEYGKDIAEIVLNMTIINVINIDMIQNL